MRSTLIDRKLVVFVCIQIAASFLAFGKSWALDERLLKSASQNLSPLAGLNKPSSVIEAYQLIEKINIDPERVINPIPLQLAVSFWLANKNQFTNKNYVSVIDYSLHSAQPRFHIIDMKTGKVESLLVSHGRGSDPDHDGMAQTFSNTPESFMTSLGFFKTDGEYRGRHDRSMYLLGLSESNSLAKERDIVIHAATYVTPERDKMGRSHGCPAVEPRLINEVIDSLKGGSLILAWAGQD